VAFYKHVTPTEFKQVERLAADPGKMADARFLESAISGSPKICRIVSVVSFRNRTAMTSKLVRIAFRLRLQIPFFPLQVLEFFANDTLAFRNRCLDFQSDSLRFYDTVVARE